MTHHVRRARLATLGMALLALTACDNDSLRPPMPTEDAGLMFRRYVAIGNSITAGFQSGGINDSTQLESYAVLVARRVGLEVGTSFHLPLLNAPGCPAPIVNIFTGDRVGDAGATDCFLRKEPIPPFLNNVAVPGAQVIDALDNLDPTSSANALTTLLLGGRTQLDAALEVEPTFVTVWIGNNDVLGAALSGDATQVTPVDAFEQTYEQLSDTLQALEIGGAALVGVANVTTIPHLSLGVAYWQAERDGELPPTFSVAANCGPAALVGLGESTLVPFNYGFGELFAQAQAGTPVTLDCLNDPEVLTAAEIATLIDAVTQYNAVIQDQAQANGWAYFDPNGPLDSLRQAGEVPPFPNATGPDAVTRPFGDFFSRDGVHPNAATHRLVADHLVDAINATYGTTIAKTP